MKSLTQRNKPELIELHQRFNIDLPSDSPTKPELLASLQANGINNAKLRALDTKKPLPVLVEDDYESTVLSDPNTGEVIVCMDRQNAFFQYGKYKFTQVHKFIPMLRSDAEDLIKRNSGFHLATREEVASYYR